MKRILILSLFLATFAFGFAQLATLNLIPQPAEMQLNKGVYTLTKSAKVSFNKPEGREVAEMLVQKLNTSTGFGLKTVQGNKGSIQ